MIVGSAGIGVADEWSDLIFDGLENLGKNYIGDKIEALPRKHGAGDFGSALARSIGDTGVERLRQAVSVASDDQETNALRGRLIDGVDAETTFGVF